jgi:Dolichyl-phosphate-mannose-protein mannosyltransferase
MPVSRRLFQLSLVAWLVILALSWGCGGPLGHDEAAYAIGGRALLAGHASPWLYRSVGMHLLAAPGVLAGGAERWLRVPALMFAVLYLFAVRRVGRLLGEPVASWSAAVVVGMHGVALRGHELLSDLPSATCVLMALAIFARELDDEDGPSVRVLGAAPWLAAAFYLRYASCVPIALVGLALALVGWRKILARPGPIVATLALFAALLVPHLMQAIAATGSPLGIIRYSSGVPHQTGPAGGLIGYLSANPFLHYGVLATPVLLAGLLSIVRAQRPAARVLWLVAVGQIVVLGLISHAQTRYIYVALTLLVVLGVDQIARVGRYARLARAAVVLAWVGVVVAIVVRAGRPDWRQQVVEAAAIIRRDAPDTACHVVSRRFTQLMWYSGCVRGNQGPGTWDLAQTPVVYAVWFDGTAGTPGPEAFRLGSGTPLPGERLAHRPGRFEIMRFVMPEL